LELGGGEDWSGEGLIEAAARELERPSSYRSQEGLGFSVRQVLANGKGGGGSVLPVFKLGAVTRVDFVTIVGGSLGR